MSADGAAKAISAEWGEAEIVRLRTLWGEGHTAPVVASRLNAEFANGRTKMAVTGKVSRLGLPPRSVETNRQQGRMNSKGRASRDAPAEPSPERKAGLARVWIRKPRLLPGQSVEDGLTIIEIRDGQCRYALTAEAPHRFCGRKQKAGRAYCAAHAKGLTVPAPPPGNPHAPEAAKDAKP
ncbi:MAG: hypothetical protein IPK75_12710 [Acidobacteria bacterium]|nr:hypothetical protein [Acidobacteriota bacterium]